MKRQDEKRELKRDTWFEDRTLFEKVLFERKDTKKPFVVAHLEAGEVVRKEFFADETAAQKTFGGGAA